MVTRFLYSCVCMLEVTTQNSHFSKFKESKEQSRTQSSPHPHPKKKVLSSFHPLSARLVPNGALECHPFVTSRKGKSLTLMTELNASLAWVRGLALHFNKHSILLFANISSQVCSSLRVHPPTQLTWTCVRLCVCVWLRLLAWMYLTDDSY